MKIGASNIHNAIKFTVYIAYDAYVDIFYGRLLFHQGRFVFVSKNILLVYITSFNAETNYKIISALSLMVTPYLTVNEQAG